MIIAPSNGLNNNIIPKIKLINEEMKILSHVFFGYLLKFSENCNLTTLLLIIINPKIIGTIDAINSGTNIKKFQN